MSVRKTGIPLLKTRTGIDQVQRDDGQKRFFDPRFNAISVMVLPGRHYVSAHPGEMIVTLLGSCVAACIRDPEAGVGGLNHFLLPASDTGAWGGTDAAMRYGNYAMEVLINDLIKRGASKARLEVKIFGGSNLIDSEAGAPVGQRNVEFVDRYLDEEGLRPVARHVGGNIPRRIHYYPVSGRVRMLLLRRKTDPELFRQEADLARSARQRPIEGDIELYD
ncbi:MAG: chemoreceptor glutamine deamidase CheD [Geminicoccaceae bacterium]|nr:chemoreceptor glutamine deamidase CheD [Geminicoccaceae bacterium]